MWLKILKYVGKTIWQTMKNLNTNW